MIAEHYRLVERIGSGGTGVVWRAIDERLQRSVAVKQIHIKPSLPEAERDVVRQRAFREARNAARFQHPNAIVVFDITEHNGDPCLVMEYMKSNSLAAVIAAQGPLPLQQVARVGEQVASALIAAHQAGIVHRDVKPGNVLLDDHGTVKITDFGISRAAGDATLTETGLICGTAAYLAPEMARGADPTPASDVFALGATLFHALEAEPPYGANANPLAVLYAAANGQVSEPRNAGPATDLLLDLLSPDPRDRPTMREAYDELSTLADSGSNAVHAAFVPATEAYARRQVGAPDSATRSLHPVAPPQHRTERQSRPLPAPPRNQHPDTAAHPRTASHQRQPAPRKSGSKRRAVLIGATIGAIVAAIGLSIGAFSASDGNTPSAQANSPATSTRAGTTTAPAPELGKTPSTGKVDIGEAGAMLEEFYDNPGANFALLTPAAQKKYGGEQAFRQYWSTRVVQSFAEITGDGRAYPDGSVDMRIARVTVSGQTAPVVVHVVQSGGKLLIDGETRSDV
ncbi:protein kinase [Nocardia sp. NPDC050712]|uniref:serine/threonine-protein kinase n=1 Tax=Nocardia sp. NPDC050712 TaxID=3155518 RepID=UPI0033FC6A97